MTMINTPLVLLAQQCGATFHTPGPMRAIRGMAFTFDQLAALVERLRAEPSQYSAAPGAAVRAFREYLAVHPNLQLGGHALDSIAQELARVALDFHTDSLGAMALEELMQLGYVVEAGRLLPPKHLPQKACHFFGVRPIETAQCLPGGTA